MTDTKDAAVAAEEPKAPAGHYYATMKERRILVKNINTAQSMLLGGMMRQIDNPRNVEDYLVLFGKLMRMVESLLPVKEDLAWLEDGILAGDIDVSDFAVIFLPLSEEEAPPTKRAPRRGK